MCGNFMLEIIPDLLGNELDMMLPTVVTFGSGVKKSPLSVI